MSKNRAGQKPAEKAKGSRHFEVYLQGANQDRLKKNSTENKKIKQQVRKWSGNPQKIEQQEVNKEEEKDDDSQELMNYLSSIGKPNLSILKQSLVIGQQNPQLLTLQQQSLIKQIVEEKDFFKNPSKQIDFVAIGNEISPIQSHNVREESQEELPDLQHYKTDFEEDIEDAKKKKQSNSNSETPKNAPQQLPKKKIIRVSKVIKSFDKPQQNNKQKKNNSIQIQNNSQFSQNKSAAMQDKQFAEKKINTNPFQQKQKPVSSVEAARQAILPVPSNEPQSEQINQLKLQQMDIILQNERLLEILIRIQKMDEDQRKDLESMIDLVEQRDQIPGLNLQQELKTFPLYFPPESKSPKNAISELFQDEIANENNQKLVIKLLNTWGDQKFIGLTEIQLFDISETKIELKQQNIKVNTNSLKQISVLLNNNYATTDANNMWLTSLNGQIEIQIDFHHKFQTQTIKIWNYNKSEKDTSKGIKDIEIIYTFNVQQCVLQSTVFKGSGSSEKVHKIKNKIDQDYATIIDLKMEAQQELIGQEIKQPIKEENDGNSSSILKFEDFQIKQDQERLPSRRYKPIVYDIFNENEGVRIPTSKSTKKQENSKQEDTVEVDEKFQKTIKFFNTNNQSRLKPFTNEIKPEEINDEEFNNEIDEFFKSQIIQKEEPLKQSEFNLENIVFIPTLPNGRYVTIKIFSTWGDRYYVGLNGIEIYDERGFLVELKDPRKQIKADPSDINVLPGNFNVKDPRTPDKLMDGIYLTQSDMHVWLCPFTRDKANLIYIDLLEKRTISMIRIWNYNKSRIHSFRGAREILINLDKQIVFAGEVRKSMGTLSLKAGCNEQMFETILFTEDQKVIEHLIVNDWINKQECGDILTRSAIRPSTGKSQIQYDERPSTAAQIVQMEQKQAVQRNAHQQVVPKGITCNWIRIILLQNWGDKKFIGLTGIQLFGIFYAKNKKLNLKEHKITVEPRDTSRQKGHEMNLVNDTNVSKDEQMMWMIPVGQCQIQLNFACETTLTGMKIYNYNKSFEEAFRGVKIFSLVTDKSAIGENVLLKRAPGSDAYDFGQYFQLPMEEITIVDQQGPLAMRVNQDYDTLHLPSGFDLKICLLTTHGDINYIGLNGIEVYDSKGNGVISSGINKCSIHASPSSVRVLEGMSNDCRLITNLLDPQNETRDDSHVWLAPFVNRYFDNIDQHLDDKLNVIYLTFDKPLLLGAISFWNYAKHPERGAYEIAIYLDDHLIYKGYLRKTSIDNNKIYNQTVALFTRTLSLIQAFDNKMYNELDKQQHVTFVNESKVLYIHVIISQRKSKPQFYANYNRPTTSAMSQDIFK